MEDNVFDSIENADKTIIYHTKLHKLLAHCIQEIGALSISMSSAYVDENTYHELYKRIKTLKQREQFYQAQLANNSSYASA